jgi:hypothetical protein
MTAQQTPFQLPVKAVEWNIHAATTIKDAAGNVLAECTGNGQHSDDAVRVAAEIEQRVNAHDELVAVARKFVDTIHTVENRCMAADGPVTPTHQEITDEELRAIYVAALAAIKATGSVS